MAPAAPKRPERKTKFERRGEIARAAVKLLGNYGLSGMSMSRIGNAVGLTKGSLYHHYANREAIIWAALELIAKTARVHVLETTGNTALERLENVGLTHGKWSARHMDTFTRPLYHLMAGAKQARLQSAMASGLKDTYAVYLGIVKDGQRDGSIRADIDPADIAWAVLMFLWAEDVALLQGVGPDVVASGLSVRNLHRLLSTFATRTSDETVDPITSQGVG